MSEIQNLTRTLCAAASCRSARLKSFIVTDAVAHRLADELSMMVRMPQGAAPHQIYTSMLAGRLHFRDVPIKVIQ